MNRPVRPIVCPPQCVVRDYYTTREVPVIHPIININRQHIVNVPRHIYQPTTRNEVVDSAYMNPSCGRGPGSISPSRGMEPGYMNPSSNMQPGYMNPSSNMQPGYMNPSSNMQPGYTNPPRGGCHRCR